MTHPVAAGADAGQAVADAWASVVHFVPKFLLFLVILVVGWVVARFVRKLVDRVLERIGFDRAVERGGIKSALARSRYDASSLVATLVYYGILLFTLQLAFGLWGPNPVSDLIHGIVNWLPKAFVAIVIVVVAAAIAAAVRDVVGNALSGLSYGRLLGTIAYWFIVGVGAIAALNQIGVATSVTTPVLVAVLATVGGILVVGVGGGLVRPMQQRWERWLDRAATESAVIAEHARSYREQAAADEAAAPAGPSTDWNRQSGFSQDAVRTQPLVVGQATAGNEAEPAVPAEPVAAPAESAGAIPAQSGPVDPIGTDPADSRRDAERTQPIDRSALTDAGRTQPVRRPAGQDPVEGETDLP
jgi:hypothetical protein